MDLYPFKQPCITLLLSDLVPAFFTGVFMFASVFNYTDIQM